MPNINATSQRVTLDDLRSEPGRLLLLPHLAALGLVASYNGAQKAVQAGRLPPPLRLPNGRPAWEARAILAAIGAA